jgi:hypothetical protein
MYIYVHLSGEKEMLQCKTMKMTIKAENMQDGLHNQWGDYDSSLIFISSCQNIKIILPEIFSTLVY